MLTCLLCYGMSLPHVRKLAPPNGKQRPLLKLLNISDQYSNDHDLIYNSEKTMCMCFTPTSCKSYECKLSLNQESLSYVREARYLGVVIPLSGTDKDVHRQMR